MRRTAVAIAAIAGLFVAGIAVPAGAATHTGYSSDRTPDSSLSARVVVSDVTSTQGGTRGRVDVYYSYSGLSMKLDPDNWIDIESRTTGYFDLINLSYVSPTHETGTFLVKGNDPVGTYYVDLSASADVRYGSGAYDDEWHWLNKEHVTSFTVKRNTAISFNATPEPVKRNAYTNATGHVSKLVPYNYGLSSHYVSATSGSVHIYFDPTGSAPKRYVTWAALNSHGNFSKRVKVTGSGTWSAAYFPGGSTYVNSSSTGDYVTAR